MAMIEAKLAQQLAYLEQEPLYGTFLYPQKVYHDATWIGIGASKLYEVMELERIFFG